MSRNVNNLSLDEPTSGEQSETQPLTLRFAGSQYDPQLEILDKDQIKGHKRAVERTKLGLAPRTCKLVSGRLSPPGTSWRTKH
jgi:hypothetical protein